MLRHPSFLNYARLAAALLLIFALSSVARAQAPQPFSLLPQGIGLTQSHAVSAASTNSTLISAGSHVLYAVNLNNTNSSTAYIRFYDTATAPTCSSATGIKLQFVLLQSKPVARFNLFGNHFANGIGYCLTGAFGDTDTTNATTGIAVDTMYK